MKLDLTDKQRKALMKGKAVQLKHAQIGSGMNIDLHPMIQKKLAKAHMAGKGMRLSLSGGESEALEGGKISLNKVLKKVGIKKVVNKNVTQKNVAKVALKGYNGINKALEKQGLPSIHGAILNEGLNYAPFVPASAKAVAGHYAEQYIDKKIAQESAKVGAGVARTVNRGLKKLGIAKDVKSIAKKINKKNVKKALDYTNNVLTNNGYDNIEDIALDKINKDRKMKGVAKDLLHDSLEGGRLVNPYIPSSYLTKQSGGKLNINAGSSKVFDDHRNILREGQAGFRADVNFDPLVNGDVFNGKKKTGAGFKIAGQGFSLAGAGVMKSRRRKA